MTLTASLFHSLLTRCTLPAQVVQSQRTAHKSCRRLEKAAPVNRARGFKSSGHVYMCADDLSLKKIQFLCLTSLVMFTCYFTSKCFDYSLGIMVVFAEIWQMFTCCQNQQHNITFKCKRTFCCCRLYLHEMEPPNNYYEYLKIYENFFSFASSVNMSSSN